MKLSISRRGVELVTTSRAAYRNWDWFKPSLIFAWPGEIYRLIARRQIAALIAENRRLRGAHPFGANPGLFERLWLAYLRHRYPADPHR